jgi:hypothetical protein
VHVRVPGPIALLQAKIANSILLQQDGRQDEKHVCILVRLMPAYLNDLHRSLKAGRIREREMLKHLEKLVRVTTSRKAESVLSRLNLNGLSMFSEIKAEPSTRLHPFLTKRIPRFFPNSC